MVAIAKAAGFLISAEELQRAQAEISEEELEGVAGGKYSDKLCLFCGLYNSATNPRKIGGC